MKRRILVTGSNGLLGNAIQRISKNFPNYEFLFTDRQKAHGELTVPANVEKLFTQTQPDYVIHTAAKTNGKDTDIFTNNVLVNTLVVHAAAVFKVRKIVTFAHPSAYSEELDVASEFDFYRGWPQTTLGVTQRMMDHHLGIVAQHSGLKYTVIVPATMYGIDDRFGLDCERFIAGCIHRCVLANGDGSPLWMPTDGSPVREVVYADDVAHLAIRIMEGNTTGPCRVNVSSGQEVSFRRVAETVCHMIKCDEKIRWKGEDKHPPKYPIIKTKTLDYYNPNFIFTSFDDGLGRVINSFRKRYPRVRA